MNEYRVYALPGNSCDILPVELVSLWVLVGWGSADRYSQDAVARAVQATDCVIAARSTTGLLLGCARVLSDGVYYATLADMVVHPDYRRCGIGRAMMELVQKHCAATGLFLEVVPEAEEFFAACGFRRRNMVVMAGSRSSGR